MIIDIVKHITEQLDVGGFKYGFGHGPSHWSNLVNDEFDFGEFQGICFLDQPITTTYQVSAGGYIGETYDINLFFMLKSEFDWTPEQHEEFCIDPANNAVRQFITLCQNANDIIDAVGNPTALEFINLLNVNVSGKSLSVTIKSRLNVSVCANAVPTFCKPAIDLIKDSGGLILYTKEIASGQTAVTSILDSVVKNSDDSYNVNVLAQGELILPDVENIDSDGTPTLTPAQRPFICKPSTASNEWLEWKIDTRIAGVNPSDTIKIGITEGTFDLDKGDGTDFEHMIITSNLDPRLTLTYAIPGEYTVRLRGWGVVFWSSATVDKTKLIGISNCGDFYHDTLNTTYFNCPNLKVTASDFFTGNIEDMRNLFFLSSSLNKLPCRINTSRVGISSNAFNGSDFDDDIGYMDMSNNSNMLNMFLGTSMSVANCDAIFTGWTRWANGQSNIELLDNVSLHMGATSFTPGGDAEAAFIYLLFTKSWLISFT